MDEIRYLFYCGNVYRYRNTSMVASQRCKNVRRLGTRKKIRQIGDRMNELFKTVLIALACPLVLPLVINDNKSNEKNNKSE